MDISKRSIAGKMLGQFYLMIAIKFLINLLHVTDLLLPTCDLI